MPIPVSDRLVHDIIAHLQRTDPGTRPWGAVAIAARFFAQRMGIDDAKRIASHIDGIDLNFPVEPVDLLPGTELIAYRFSPQPLFDHLDPFGSYFTDVGVSKFFVGVPTDHRRFIRYLVKHRATALKTRARTGRVPAMGVVRGGAVQYVIPNASQVLRVVHIQHAVTS